MTGGDAFQAHLERTSLVSPVTALRPGKALHHVAFHKNAVKVPS